LKGIEKNVKNKWNWSWMEERDANADFLSEYIRKINQPGIAMSCVFGVISNSSTLQPARKFSKRTR